MSQWARNNPEAYEQGGHDAMYEAYAEKVDRRRKERKEEESCERCGGKGWRKQTRVCYRCQGTGRA